ncbi:MAG TPA: hypothetical protein DC057_02425 [Spirochaetia bacterium]|nr:hypothetical protein [Spirochaetia bacterium]
MVNKKKKKKKGFKMYTDKLNDFFNVVDQLIELNKQNRNTTAKKYLDEISYLKQYCTIIVDIGRNVGKTTYIRSRAKENDLIIVSSMFSIIGTKSHQEILYNQTSFRNNGYETIYIDEPKRCFAELNFDEFLQRIVNSKLEQTIICLGTWN